MICDWSGAEKFWFKLPNRDVSGRRLYSAELCDETSTSARRWVPSTKKPIRTSNKGKVSKCSWLKSLTSRWNKNEFTLNDFKYTVDVEMKTVIANSIEYFIPDHLHPHSDPNPQLNRIVPIFNHTPNGRQNTLCTFRV